MVQNVISETTVLQADLVIPLKDGGKIIIGPAGLKIVGTKKNVETPNFTMDSSGLKGFDAQGSLVVHWDAQTGALTDYAGEASVPQNLEVVAMANGLVIVSAVYPKLNTAGLVMAEFRAKFFALGTTYPQTVDLRTVDEGGTFSADGVSTIHAGCLPTLILGASYSFTSPAHGRWYYAWRIKNAAGWSAWSDGNLTPSLVSDYIDTINATDTGPPANWTVTLERAAGNNNFYHIRASRPTTNGNTIMAVRYQVKDANTGAWRLVDAADGAAITYYDGSNNNHTLGYGGGRITLDEAGNIQGANVGDLVLLDVRGANNWAVEHCKWSKVNYLDPGNAFFEVNPPFPCNTATPDYRCKIVKHPEIWENDANNAWDGYYGNEAGHGYTETYFPAGDVSTQTFVSPPIYGNNAVTPEGRVWFANPYSTSDDNNTHSNGIYTPGGGNTSPIGNNQDLSDFNNSSMWMAINTYPPSVALTVATNNITVVGNVTGTPWANEYQAIYQQAGVISRGVFLHDLTTGKLIFRVGITNFRSTYCWNNSKYPALNSYWGPHIYYILPVDSGSGVTMEGPMSLGLARRPASNNNTRVSLDWFSYISSNHGFTHNSNGFLNAWNNGSNNDSIAITVTHDITQGGSTGGTTGLRIPQAVGELSYNGTLTGNNVVTHNLHPQNGFNWQNTFIPGATFGGWPIRLFIGLIANREADNTAYFTISEFTLIEGRFYPDSVGGAGDPTFVSQPSAQPSGGGGSGVKIFSVTAV